LYRDIEIYNGMARFPWQHTRTAFLLWVLTA